MAWNFAQRKKGLILSIYSLKLQKKELTISLISRDCNFISYEFQKSMEMASKMPQIFELALIETNLSQFKILKNPEKNSKNIQLDPYKNSEEIIYYEEEFVDEIEEENVKLILKKDSNISNKKFIQKNFLKTSENLQTQSNNNENQLETQKNPYKISEKTKEILRQAIHKPIVRMENMTNLSAEEFLKNSPSNYYEPSQVDIQKISFSEKSTKQHKTNKKVHENEVNSVSEELLMPSTESFTEIFNQKVEKEKSNTSKYAELLSLENLNSKLDCLVACAYHLIERENFERFTLKQINTLSKPLMEEAIGHETIKAALERHFIKIIPDYTGIATTLEYTITDEGMRYFEQQIQS